MTIKVWSFPAETPWTPATIVVGDKCVECREAEAVTVWNRCFAVCQPCADRWQAEIDRKRQRAAAQARLWETSHARRR